MKTNQKNKENARKTKTIKNQTEVDKSKKNKRKQSKA